MNKYYAVRKGKQPGIYSTWEECKEQVDGYSGADFKKFNTKGEAEIFMGLEDKNQVTYLNLNSRLVAYVDGSYNIADGSYSYGAVIIKEEEKIELFSKRFKRDAFSEHRNVMGEIYGAMFAMEYAVSEGYKELILNYDYEGIEKWATGVWKRNKEATRMYYNFFQDIKKNLLVTFVKVKAHSGDKYNEMADKLAKEAKIPD